MFKKFKDIKSLDGLYGYIRAGNPIPRKLNDILSSLIVYMIENNNNIVYDYSNGFTLLHYAILLNNLDLAEYIINEGEVINNEGGVINTYTDVPPIILAAIHKRDDIIRLLVKKGADITMTDFKDKTAYEFYPEIEYIINAVGVEEMKEIIGQQTNTDPHFLESLDELLPPGSSKNKFGKINKRLKSKAKKFGIRLTVKRNGKRVSKSHKVLEQQVRRRSRRK